MFEDLKVVAGQVIADDAMVLARTEEDQLELAVRQHAQLVYRIAYSVLRNHHDAEDATQETFVRVLRAKRKLSTVNDPQKWLARIAWRVAVERRKKVPDISSEENAELVSRLSTAEISADETLIAREASAVLDRVIPSLPRRLRDVLTLLTVQEMSPADVASVLKISEAAVRSRLFRAREILREKITALLVESHDKKR
jgi:RNA polymerase sigma-70 factor (ECF subfamily)